MKELIVAAKIENIEQVQNFISAETSDFDSKPRHQLMIAVDEVFSNIANYAYTHETGDVTVRVSVEKNITIEFEDMGAPYDPLSADAPDTTLGLEEREPGGMGIFMVRSLMDSVEYRREGNKNILTIRKSVS